MSSFKDVEIIKAANIYFEGKPFGKRSFDDKYSIKQLFGRAIILGAGIMGGNYFGSRIYGGNVFPNQGVP